MKLSSSGSSKHPKALKAPKVNFIIHILKTPIYLWHLNAIFIKAAVWFRFVIIVEVGGNFLSKTKWLLLQ